MIKKVFILGRTFKAMQIKRGKATKNKKFFEHPNRSICWNTNKRGQMWQQLAPWVIGITVLAIVGIFSFLLRDKLADLGAKALSILRGKG